MLYSEPVFRPPSEGNSLIVQITEGCPNNGCKFCAMYKMKKYKEKSPDELNRHIEGLARHSEIQSKRCFLADGDSLHMETDKLLELMKRIKSRFTQINRFGIYGSVFSLYKKSIDDLTRLKETGLRFVYLGIESGDEDVLRKMNKYTPAKDIIDNCRKVCAAGVNLSVMVIIGLGGKEDSKNHIRKSARVVNEIAPNYTSLLNLMLKHTPLEDDPCYNQFSVDDYLDEIRGFIENISCSTIFRSNHSSNYLPLEGRLPKDKKVLLEKVAGFHK